MGNNGGRPLARPKRRDAASTARMDLRLPSLRTGRADFPQPALPLIVLPQRGLTRLRNGTCQGQGPVLGKERIWPALLVTPTSPTGLARPVAEDPPQPHADPIVHGRERACATVWEVLEPTPQRPVHRGDQIRPAGAVRPPRPATERLLELLQAFLPWPTAQTSPFRGLEVIVQEVNAFRPYLHDFGFGRVQLQTGRGAPLPNARQGLLRLGRTRGPSYEPAVP